MSEIPERITLLQVLVVAQTLTESVPDWELVPYTLHNPLHTNAIVLALPPAHRQPLPLPSPPPLLPTTAHAVARLQVTPSLPYLYGSRVGAACTAAGIPCRVLLALSPARVGAAPAAGLRASDRKEAVKRLPTPMGTLTSPTPKSLSPSP
ncbi:hypothetical protein GALMADRAFT_143272 [Galerina marginata CBS 339.88]|uniref:Uncharacterized protein n=1 Tax=Galerina marginata (strain CBS 339.88) TaxID=685588 RepID=A0A067SXQ7_GALM3|nr:hypothetical protein GALMADRAFT_143272 [Galerina marginata CBS 339.88]